MTCDNQCTQFNLAMELLIQHGFTGMADVMAIMLNASMQHERTRFLQAEQHERTSLHFSSIQAASDSKFLAVNHSMLCLLSKHCRRWRRLD